METTDQIGTDLKGEQDVAPRTAERWLQQVTNFMDWRRAYYNGDRTWRAAYYLARAKQWSDAVQSDDSLKFEADLLDKNITVPTIAMHCENMVSYLMQTDPEFLGKPRKAEYVDSAPVQAAWLQYTWDELDFGEQVKDALRDLVTIGHGVMSTGFMPRVDYDNLRPEDGDVAELLNYDDFLRPGKPWARRVNPFLFVFDRFAPDGRLSTASWAGEFVVRPMLDILHDNNYDQDARSDSKGKIMTLAEFKNTYEEQSGTLLRSDEENLSNEFGILVRIFSKRHRKMYVFALGYTEAPLLEIAWPYKYLLELPYIKRDFIRVPNEPYGIGFVHYAAQLQGLQNRIRSKMREHVLKHNAKYKYIGDIDNAQTNLFEADVHGTGVKLSQGQDIQPIERPQFGEDLFRIAQIVESDMGRLMMENEISSGALPGRTSAEEIRTRSRLFSAKLQDARSTTEKLLTHTARQTLQHLKGNFDRGELVRVVGRDGVKYVELTQDQVDAEIDIEIAAVAKEAVDPATKRAESTQLLREMASLLPAIYQIQQQQVMAMQQGQMAPVPITPVNIDFNQLIRYVFEQHDDKTLERALPELGVMPPPLNPALLPPPPKPPGNPQQAPQPQDPAQSVAQEAQPTPALALAQGTPAS